MNRYVEETHSYYIADVEVPYISLLLPQQDFYVSEARLEKTKQEGLDNHSMIKMYTDIGNTFNDPMLIAFQKWEKENQELLGELIQYEQPLFSSRYMFGGTPDRIYTKAIVEIKRSFGNKLILALQMAGQSILSCENKIARKTKNWLVVWFESGQYKSKNVYNDQAEDIFICLTKKFYAEKALNNYLKGV